MNLANKSFRDNRTGEVIKVIDSFENIAILENKTKIDTRRLMDQNYYTEYIDPGQFQTTSSSAYTSLFETIKNIPTDSIPVDDEIVVSPRNDGFVPASDVGSAVYSTSVEDERAELARKYGASIDNTNVMNRQNQAFARILGEDSIDELPVVRQSETNVQRVDVVRDEVGKVVSSEVVTEASVATERPRVNTPVVEVDPFEMFRGIKRPIDFRLDLPLLNKIPKLQFIEMMEESYDKSIIEFLAQDITEEILRNPDSLRKSIQERIKEMVYGKTEEKPKRPAVKRTPKPNTAVGEKPGYQKPAAKKVAAKKNDALSIEKEPVLSKDLEEIRAPKSRSTKKEVQK